jgi:hypothetical protein
MAAYLVIKLKEFFHILDKQVRQKLPDTTRSFLNLGIPLFWVTTPSPNFVSRQYENALNTASEKRSFSETRCQPISGQDTLPIL